MAAPTAPQTEITTKDVDPTIHLTGPAAPDTDAPVNAGTTGVPPQGVTVGQGIGQAEPLVDRGDTDIPNETAEQRQGVGVEGETEVWEGRYAMRNFLGRLIGLGVLSLAWVALAIYAWGFEREGGGTGANGLAVVSGLVLGVLWLLLVRRVILARYGHFYRLTNRRLFVSTGLFVRRRDQMELLKVQDVFTRQTFTGRLLSVGTVVVQSKEPHLPVMYLTGVEDPKEVMDLVWHHARAERDRRSLKVDAV